MEELAQIHGSLLIDRNVLKMKLNLINGKNMIGWIKPVN